MIQQFCSWAYIQKKTYNSKKIHIHSSTIPNSWNVETTWMSIDRWTGTEHTHKQSTTWPKKIKNQVMPICSNMDGTRDHYTKWSKSEEKDKYHISFICGI